MNTPFLQCALWLPLCIAVLLFPRAVDKIVKRLKVREFSGILGIVTFAVILVYAGLTAVLLNLVPRPPAFEMRHEGQDARLTAAWWCIFCSLAAFVNTFVAFFRAIDNAEYVSAGNKTSGSVLLLTIAFMGTFYLMLCAASIGSS